MDKKQEFLKRILATFKVEAEENTILLSANLIELEKEPPDLRKKELVEEIYRSAHSLKGAARAVNLYEIEKLCHAFEDVMSAIRSQRITFNSQIYDALHQSVDLINELLIATEYSAKKELENKVKEQLAILSSIEEEEYIYNKSQTPIVKTKDETVSYEKIADVESSIDSNKDSENSNEIPLIVTNQSIKNKPKDLESTKKTIRISTLKLDNILSQTEEMLSIKLGTIQRSKNLQNVLNKLNVWTKEVSQIYESKNKIQQILEKKGSGINGAEKELIKFMSFCERTTSHLKEIEKDICDIHNSSIQEIFSTSSKIETLLGDVRELITVPFSTLSDGFPKMVRDIAKDLDKKVDFVIEGADTEIDRRILDNLRNPLIHLLRNSIDYGIESTESREKYGKSLNGKISIKIEQLENNKVNIQIRDDGAGVNIDKIRELYIKNEKIDQKEIVKLTDKECLNYIFNSGVSTTDIVTDLSGRGLGLAIVQEAIEQLGGTINVETEKGKYTSFNLQLPLSIVTFRGVLLEVSGSEFVVPTAKIQKVLKIKIDEVTTVENKATITLEGEIIPLIDLGKILELSVSNINTEFIQVIVFELKRKKIGFRVNKIIGEQEVLVKKFNQQLKRVRNITGVTILGSRKIVPILNIADLFKSSAKIKSSGLTTTSDNSDNKSVKSVLVVEDSITSRSLLKNILESSGYTVVTAVDGVDGFAKLKEGDFDAVVTDVEMPRMNGFELTKKIKGNKDSADIPILLVTSLSKREDREKGIEAGADAYIVKSSFDQSNLLEILERLI